MLLRAKLMIVAGVLASSMLLGFWIHYRGIQKKLHDAVTENAQQAVQIAEQKAVQAQMEKDIHKNAEAQQNFNKSIQQAQRSIDTMRDKFTPRTDAATGQTTTLGQRAVEKTDSIERAVNRGTYNQLRCFEIQTGSPLTEEERNGTKLNTICPELFTAPSVVKPGSTGTAISK